MRYAVIKDGAVENIVSAGAGFSVPGRLMVPVSQPVAIGDLWDGSSFSTPDPDPNDFPLNRFQFEAFAMSMGLSFAQIEGAINQLPITAEEKAIAISRLRNAETYNRNHPLFDMLKSTLNVTDAAIDTQWLQAKDLK